MNPFEIRAQLLEQAQEYLTRQHELNTEFAKRAFDQLVVSGQKVQADYKDYMPKMYSFEEITAKARELYRFVNAK